jgi:dihydroneopterin aldolase
MTRFLASVSSIEEAEVVLDQGADIVDLKAPADGVLGALPSEVMRGVVDHVAGRRPVSAATGDLFPDPDIVRLAVRESRAAGVDIVKVGLFEQTGRSELLRALGQEARGGTTIVAVLFADREGDLCADLGEIARQGLYGVMLDTCQKSGRGLRVYRDDAELGLFVRRARSLGLRAGLAGSLVVDDIAALLPLAPDYLGFRGALCAGGRRVGSVDPGAVRAIRTRIPVNGSTIGASTSRGCHHELAG